MSLYDWRCVVCNFIVDDVLHPSDLDFCPKCRSRSWTKITPAPANVKIIGGTPKFYDKDT